MKTRTLVIELIASIVILGTPVAATAQATPATSSSPGASAGIKAGLSLSTITVQDDDLLAGEQVDRTRGLTAGGWVQTDLTDSAFVRIEALLAQKGMAPRFRETYFGERIDLKSTVRLTYLDVPVLAGWQSPGAQGPRFSVFAGPSLGWKLSSSFKINSVELDGEDVTDEFDGEFDDLEEDLGDELDDAIGRLDFGLVLGAGVNVGSLTIDARYSLGLKDVSTEDGSGSSKNRSFVVMLGFRFK